MQPVVPFSLNDDWNLISRTILPIVALLEAEFERLFDGPFVPGAHWASASLDVRLVAKPVPKGSRVVRLSRVHHTRVRQRSACSFWARSSRTVYCTLTNNSRRGMPNREKGAFKLLNLMLRLKS